MDMGLKDKVAIVIGAGGAGIGNAIALTLAREGAHVVTNDFKRELADKSAEQVKSLGFVLWPPMPTLHHSPAPTRWPSKRSRNLAVSTFW